MIEIPIPKEIKDYEPKYIFGLTFRQNITIGIMLLINIPLYNLGKNNINTELLSWIMILVSVPIIAIGFFRYNGMRFEEFLVAFIQTNFIYPKKRVYKTRNVFSEVKKEIIKGELNRQKLENAEEKKLAKRKKARENREKLLGKKGGSKKNVKKAKEEIREEQG